MLNTLPRIPPFSSIPRMAVEPPITELSSSAAIAQLRQRVDASLRGYVTFPADCPTVLGESMRYSVAAGGKRVRPVLTLLACEAAAAPSKQRCPQPVRLS